MTKTEAMQNFLGTICVIEMESDNIHYMFNSMSGCYSLSIFTGNDIETAKRVLDKYRYGFVDGTLMEIVELESTYCVHIEWQW